MSCASNSGGSRARGPRKVGEVHTIVSSVRTQMVDESRGTPNHPLGSFLGPRYTNAVQIACKGMQTWVAQCPRTIYKPIRLRGNCQFSVCCVRSWTLPRIWDLDTMAVSLTISQLPNCIRTDVYYSCLRALIAPAPKITIQVYLAARPLAQIHHLDLHTVN
jgi:hypothetical protein